MEEQDNYPLSARKSEKIIYNSAKLNKLSNFIIFISICFALFYCGNYLINLPYFKINKFNIHSSNININLNYLQRQLSANKYSFFSPSLEDIRQIFIKLPSVKQVTITRQYPNQLNIILEKQQPFAKWGNDDDQYINQNGDIYQGSNYDESLVNINLYSEDINSGKFLVQQYLFLKPHFLPNTIKSILHNNQKNLLVILDNNFILTIGREENEVLAKKIKFWRHNWNTLKDNPLYANINKFDLRYDGFTMQLNPNITNETTSNVSLGIINAENIQ